jgi:hypothetical protein
VHALIFDALVWQEDGELHHAFVGLAPMFDHLVNASMDLGVFKNLHFL